MLKVLNIVPEVEPKSETKGWKVDIRTRDNGKPNYRVVLEGSDSKTGLAIDRNHYEKLTTAQGIDPNASSKLISLVSNDIYRPMLTGVKNDTEDELIVLFNFETEIGDVISDIRIGNMLAVSYHIRKVNDRMLFTALLVSSDSHESSSISIDYGRLGGKSQITQTIEFDPIYNRRNPLGYQFIKDVNSIETGIVTKKIELTRMALSTICANN